MHHFLEGISKYFAWHLCLFYPMQGKDIYSDMSCATPWLWPWEGAVPMQGWHTTHTCQEGRTLQALPGSLSEHKGLLPARAQLFGIYCQMCRHGNPSQALNLPPCRGMLSLLAAVFPPSTSLPKLEEWDVPGTALGAFSCWRYWAMCSKCWSYARSGIVTLLASLQRGAQLLNCAPWSGVESPSLTGGELGFPLLVLDLVQQGRLQPAVLLAGHLLKPHMRVWWVLEMSCAICPLNTTPGWELGWGCGRCVFM